MTRHSRKGYLLSTALGTGTGLLIATGDNGVWGGWVLAAVGLTLFVLTLARAPGMPRG